jgi:hypothetical protein
MSEARGFTAISIKLGGQSVGSPQKIASTTMPDLNKKSIPPHVESPTLTSQNSSPYSVLYFPPGTLECNDDPFF